MEEDATERDGEQIRAQEAAGVDGGAPGRADAAGHGDPALLKSAEDVGEGVVGQRDGLVMPLRTAAGRLERQTLVTIHRLRFTKKAERFDWGLLQFVGRRRFLLFGVSGDKMGKNSAYQAISTYHNWDQELSGYQSCN
jgi:hypothetical protein